MGARVRCSRAEGALHGRREGTGTIAATHHRRDRRLRGERGAALDCGDGEIELRSAPLTGQRDANRVEQREIGRASCRERV